MLTRPVFLLPLPYQSKGKMPLLCAESSLPQSELVLSCTANDLQCWELQHWYWTVASTPLPRTPQQRTVSAHHSENNVIIRQLLTHADNQHCNIDTRNQEDIVHVCLQTSSVYFQQLFCSGLAWQEPQSFISFGLISTCSTGCALGSWSLKPWLNKTLQIPHGGSRSEPSWGRTSKSLWSSQPCWSNFPLVFSCKLCTLAFSNFQWVFQWQPAIFHIMAVPMQACTA